MSLRSLIRNGKESSPSFGMMVAFVLVVPLWMLIMWGILKALGKL